MEDVIKQLITTLYIVSPWTHQRVSDMHLRLQLIKIVPSHDHK